MSHASIDRILSCPSLPTLPVVALRVLELTAKRDVSLRELASVIENDPAIATKVLRTVNSSYYSLSRRCGSIQQALAFLGLQTVKALVLGFSLARSIDGGGDDEVAFDYLAYWRRSLFSAAAAREIALLARRCDPDEAFVAALVGDLGMVALWHAYGDRYLQVIDLAKGDHRRLSAIEQRTLDIDHALVGAEMLSRWRFPEEIQTSVRCHHRSEDADAAAAQLARTVELAGTAASVLCSKSPEAELARFRREGQEWFDLRPAPLTLLLQKIADRADELSRAFGLEIGATPDVDAILEKAASIRREQNIAPLDAAGDSCDVVAHGTVSLSDIRDARAFGGELENAFLSHCRKGGIGVLLVGIDRAKSVQESFGARGVEAAMNHALGAIRRALGERAGVYRFVGAELVCIVPETDTEELCRLAELVRRGALESSVRFEHASGAGFPASVSIGVAIYETMPELRAGTGIETPDQLVRAAMFALAAGRKTRNRVVVFQNELVAEHEQR
jgi:diguanylate cyclase (GGDEF)-like protein